MPESHVGIRRGVWLAIRTRMAETATLDVNPAHEESAPPEMAPVVRAEHREGTLARMVEQQTAKIPSDLFLLASLSAMGLSLVAEFSGRPKASRFVGMWVGPLLTMGVYNKLVKMLGPR